MTAPAPMHRQMSTTSILLYLLAVPVLISLCLGGCNAFGAAVGATDDQSVESTQR
ncbi:hypothetical protein GCM10010123_30500 [Pilimelia anulata]|uniref:Uncharacterized protein n=1 Tax=Pilimelia anulata TaxID=53371 RepID=A0A8J3BD75_9ACTN|nr:hypothetical protein [Pilimelia anulata]GGJ98420.1 hypothetical protein GCM10010123_30500 [Pilimelia anulata]